MWTEESVRAEDEYRRAHLHRVAAHHALDTVGRASRVTRSDGRAATWWRWLRLSARH